MQITGRLSDLCPNGPDCPRIHDTDGDHVIVQGDALTDPAMLAELHLPAHEAAVVVPRELVYPAPMDLAEMFAWITERHTFHLLRVENRARYSAGSDGEDFRRYMRGEADPTEGKSWQDHIRADTAARKTWTKLHIVHGPRLSDYERYEFDWGFRYTVDAGEQVRILQVGQDDLVDFPDFWVVDRQHVVVSIYDSSDRFTGARIVTGPDAATYRALAQVLWHDAQPFAAWWEQHPHEHRGRRAA
jgi:hypothetical protein